MTMDRRLKQTMMMKNSKAPRQRRAGEGGRGRYRQARDGTSGVDRLPAIAGQRAEGGLASGWRRYRLRASCAGAGSKLQERGRNGIGAWRSPVSALVWETRGRRFKSSRSDHFTQ